MIWYYMLYVYVVTLLVLCWVLGVVFELVLVCLLGVFVVSLGNVCCVDGGENDSVRCLRSS